MKEFVKNVKEFYYGNNDLKQIGRKTLSLVKKNSGLQTVEGD